MATKRPRKHRLANVAVPLNGAEFCRRLSRAIGGSIAAEFEHCTANGLVPFERELEPAAYSCPDSFRRDYQLAMMLSKYDDEKSSEEKKRTAFGKFRLSEEQCLSTNQRFGFFVGGALQNGVTVEACLYTAQRKIQRLLGPLDLDEVASGFGFGPGASTRLGRVQSDTWYKFQGKPETTPNNTVFSHAVFLHSPLWKQSVLTEEESLSTPFKVVRANRVITVPKSAKTDRIIAIEPDLNLFVQKGFGATIRRRLKKVGVNLNDQTQNQYLAKVGSIDGSLATLDLSMASDTVSRAVVEHLLPPDWLEALEQCRSPEGRLPSGEIIRYQKFSSMGNGFTFELESLIFWALISSVADLTGETDRRISVYGDDLIVPTGIVEPVIGLLLLCGFKTNSRKSFWTGPFRESCGKHYFRGHDVTPFFLRSQPKRLSDVFLLHNNIVRWSTSYGSYSVRWAGIDSGLFDLCQTLRASVPSNWRKPRIPDGVGDGAFIGSFDEVCPTLAPRGFCGWRVEVLTEPRRLSDRGGTGRLLKSLWRLEGSPEPLRWVVMGPSVVSWRQSTRRQEGAEGICGSSDYYLPHSRFNFGGRVFRDEAREMGDRSEDPHIRSMEGKSLSRLLSFQKQQFSVPMTARAKVVKALVTQWAELGPWY